MVYVYEVILQLIMCVCWVSRSVAQVHGTVFQNYPPNCDVNKAAQCEYEQLQCKLFSGYANDPATLCRCGEQFYGVCLRAAGCETHPQVGALTAHEIYMKTCIDVLTSSDCPNPYMCITNCASDGEVDPTATKIIPFNNYGEYYLRIRICEHVVHKQEYSRYSTVNTVPCKDLQDFRICSRFIPPLTFVPVALPINTTYVEVDSCQLSNTPPPDGIHGAPPPYYTCTNTGVPPARFYGNKYLFPRTFDVAQTNVSICQSDGNCLGSYCDLHFDPPVCSPKTLKHVTSTGKFYLSNPFG